MICSTCNQFTSLGSLYSYWSTHWGKGYGSSSSHVYRVVFFSFQNSMSFQLISFKLMLLEIEIWIAKYNKVY